MIVSFNGKLYDNRKSGRPEPLLVTLTKYCHYYNGYLRGHWQFDYVKLGIKPNYRDQQQLSFVILLTLPYPGSNAKKYGRWTDDSPGISK